MEELVWAACCRRAIENDFVVGSHVVQHGDRVRRGLDAVHTFTASGCKSKSVSPWHMRDVRRLRNLEGEGRARRVWAPYKVTCVVHRHMHNTHTYTNVIITPEAVQILVSTLQGAGTKQAHIHNANMHAHTNVVISPEDVQTLTLTHTRAHLLLSHHTNQHAHSRHTKVDSHGAGYMGCCHRRAGDGSGCG